MFKEKKKKAEKVFILFFSAKLSINVTKGRWLLMIGVGCCCRKSETFIKIMRFIWWEIKTEI